MGECSYNPRQKLTNHDTHVSLICSVLATCHIRPLNQAFESTFPCLSQLADSCNGYLGHPFKNMRFENENDLPPLLANKGR
jgi:hypothetical protein